MNDYEYQIFLIILYQLTQFLDNQIIKIYSFFINQSYKNTLTLSYVREKDNA
jgi:hypothetical protein